MKKLYTLRRTLSVAVLLMMSAFAWAYDFEMDGIYYNINEDGIGVSVTSSGVRYSGEVVVPASVTYNGATYSVTSIGGSAFYNCSSLTSISLPESVTSIGYNAFAFCSSLTSISIPGSVTNIRNNTLYYCSSLTSITVAANNPVYDSREGCNAIIETATNTLISGCQTTIIPENVTSIGNMAFYYCSSLTSISIPESVTSIGDGAFYGCPSLASISLSEGVTSIGSSAFSDCFSLTSISIPESVTSISGYAFYGCSSLTSITVATNNPVYDSREGCNAIIETSSNTLMTGCRNTIIPEGVTNIGGWAFESCRYLTSISIPESVTSIGELAFSGCSSLTSISIPENVTSIGDAAFSKCSSLASISIPESVTYIGVEAFTGCYSITSITVASNNPVYDSREGCNAIIETSSNTLVAGCQTTVIPNGVTSIEDYAFSGHSSLTSIFIPESVTNIGNGAFMRCSSLSSISIPEGMTYIEDYTFSGCSSLTSISIPESVTYIGEYAFRDCYSFIFIICYAEKVPELWNRVFDQVPTSNATLYVPASAIEDYKAADQWKDFGKILPLEDIPSSINKVEADATNAPYYTLDGIKVDNPTQKGIYIKGGKKYLIK